MINLIEIVPQGRYVSGQLSTDGNGTTGNATLKWNGSPSDSQGAVRLHSSAKLEDGKTYRNVLHMHPKWVDKGTIKGFLPWKVLPLYPVFRADVGFLSGAENTDGVSFQVWEHHKVNDKEVWNRVINLQKKYNGKLTAIQADLSHLAGQSVGIELRVDAGNSSTQDWAIWLNPRIETSTNIQADVKLDGNVLIAEGHILHATTHDLKLDNPSRRKSANGHRRALVHGFNDELVINWKGDYPGGTRINGELYLADASQRNTIYLDPGRGNMFLGGSGEDGDFVVRKSDGKNSVQLDADVNRLSFFGEDGKSIALSISGKDVTAAPWPAWPGKASSDHLNLIAEMRRMKEEILQLKKEVENLKKGKLI